MVFEHDYKKFPELTNQQINDFGFTSPHIQYTEDFEAVVEKVHDGDTLTLSTSEREFTFPLRLLNVDAKELSEGGEDAGNWLRDRVLNKGVKIQMDRTQRVGKYGRLLGRVIHQGLDVSEEMMNLSLATTFERRREGVILPFSKWTQDGRIR